MSETYEHVNHFTYFDVTFNQDIPGPYSVKLEGKRLASGVEEEVLMFVGGQSVPAVWDSFGNVLVTEQQEALG